ncbi:MAG TPA: hypothetical protein VK698_27685 [Kofleriaceae bacterium]|nr:hypothetical protein [Kofleriaceae bacterium]
MAYERPTRQTPRDLFLVLRIVHAAMMVSVLVYGGVVAMVTRPPPPDSVVAWAPKPRTDVPETTTAVLAVIAAATLVAVSAVRRRIRPGRYTTLAILSWALTETIAVDGLVLGMVHRDVLHFLPFGAVSFVVMLLLAPRSKHLELLTPPA